MFRRQHVRRETCLQVEAFDDEVCDQIFLKPVTDKMCPGYSEAIKQPTCLTHIGCVHFCHFLW